MADEILRRRLAPWMARPLGGRFQLDQVVAFDRGVASFAARTLEGAEALVRMLLPELSNDAGAVAALRHERRALAGIAHPALPAHLAEGIDDGAAWVAVERIRGRSLKDVAAQRAGQRLAAYEVLAVADAVLEALAAVHAHGVVHANIKPEKIVIDRGRVRLIDFGSAIVGHAPAPSAAVGGGKLGTPAFQAPELAQGSVAEVDGRSDLWALGATMFALLSGRLVREAPSPNQQLLLAMTRPAPPLASVVADVAPALAAVVDRAMAFDAPSRWPDATAMRMALGAAAAAVVPPPGGSSWLPAVSDELADDPTVDRGSEASLGRPPAPSAGNRDGVGKSVLDRGAVGKSPLDRTMLGSQTLTSAGVAVAPLPFRPAPIEGGLPSLVSSIAGTPGTAPSPEHARARPAVGTGTLAATSRADVAALPFREVATAAQSEAPRPETPPPVRPRPDPVPAADARKAAVSNVTLTAASAAAFGAPLPFDAQGSPAAAVGRSEPRRDAGVGSGTLMFRRAPAPARLPFHDERARVPLVILSAPADPTAEPDLALVDRVVAVRLELWSGAERRSVLARHGLDELAWRELDAALATRLGRDAELGRGALALRVADRMIAARGAAPRRGDEVEIFVVVRSELTARGAEALAEIVAAHGLALDAWRALDRRIRLRARKDPLFDLDVRTRLARAAAPGRIAAARRDADRRREES